MTDKPDNRPEALDQINQAVAKFNKQREESQREHVERHKARLRDAAQLAAFCEHYARLDSWLLESEALAICVGAHPKEWEAVKPLYPRWLNQVNPLIEAGKGVSLDILNPNEKPRKWRVEPKGFVRWLQAKEVPVRPELEAALGLTPDDSPDRKTGGTYSDHKNAEYHAQRRERVLKAALAVLAAVPEKCKKNGKVSAAAIVAQTEVFSDSVYGKYQEPPFSQRRMREIVNEALGLIPDK